MKKLYFLLTAIWLPMAAGAQFGNANQIMLQQQRQMQMQQMQMQRQLNQAMRGVNNNIVVQQPNLSVPPGAFTISQMRVNVNGADDNGNKLLRCDYKLRVTDTRFNALKIVATLESPKGTVLTDRNGNSMEYVSQPMNVFNTNVNNSLWVGFYKESFDILPGANTYFFCVRVYSCRTNTYVSNPYYVSFGMTGRTPAPKMEQAMAPEKTMQESAMASQQLTKTVVAPKQQEKQQAKTVQNTEVAKNVEVSQPEEKPQKTKAPSNGIVYQAINEKVVLKANTRIPMESTERLTVENASEGDVVNYEVTDDVYVDGHIVIPKGSVGKVEVKNVNHATSLFRFTEKMELTPSFLILPNGSQINLAKKNIVVSGAAAGMDGARGVLRKGHRISAEVKSNTKANIFKRIEEKNMAQTHINNTDVKSLLTGQSDVDADIPQAATSAENTFAVIIANENYIDEAEVEYAINDGRAFKEYCRKTLGLPDLNIHYCENATKNSLEAEVDWIAKIAEAYEGDANIIFYYAGHGIPDEKTNTGYLLPVDGKGNNISTGYSIDELYKQLSVIPARSVVLFMDACFSGSKRGEGMLVSARGVKIKTKAAEPQGKLIVLTATQGDETAYPYHEKKHGLFTYFLLKKLKETKGDCSFSELGNYVKQQVIRNSLRVNGKSQTPSIHVSSALGEMWKKKTLK